jgi:signal transduction histidine kinase
MDNADLAELVRQQESLREVIESISSELELRPLLTRIVRHACELLGADRGTIGLVDEQHKVVRTEAVYHMPEDELGAEMPPGVGLSGQVFKTQAPLILNRYRDIEQPTQPALLEDAVIGLPIFWRDRMIGFFGIGAAPPRRFTDRDVETLSLYARHAAIAIENARLFTGMQQALAETQLLYETSRRISAAVDIDEVIVAYLEHVALRGRYTCTIVLYEMNEQAKRTAVIVRGRWAPGEGLSLAQTRLPYTRDALDSPLDAGELITISDVHTDPRCSAELRQIQIESGRPALTFIPLVVAGQRIGLVILSYPAVHEWRKADLRPYEVTAAQLAIAINTRQQQLLLYESGQQVAVLRERQRLARELHDSVTQLLFSVTLIAQSITPAWQRSPAEGERRVNRLLELSQNALSEMRALLFELRSPEPVSYLSDSRTFLPGALQVQRDGLATALGKHIATLAAYGPAIDFHAPTYQPQTLEQEMALFRITQEALNNIVKHAQAKHVTIHLCYEKGFTYLTVEDDGTGFNQDVGEDSYESSRLPATEYSPDSGFGLRTMRERAEALGGTLQIVSTPGVGTKVKVLLPENGRSEK